MDVLHKKKCGKRVSTRLISRLGKKLGITQPMRITLKEMKERRTEARKKYDRLKTNSREIRDS